MVTVLPNASVVPFVAPGNEIPQSAPELVIEVAGAK